MIEREWREASDLRTSRVALAIVLIAAAVLRFWALGRGIPYAVQIDEPEIVERAFNMMRSGSLNPHGFFDYPGLAIYVQLIVSVIRFVAGARKKRVSAGPPVSHAKLTAVMIAASTSSFTAISSAMQSAIDAL